MGIAASCNPNKNPRPVRGFALIPSPHGGGIRTEAYGLYKPLSSVLIQLPHGGKKRIVAYGLPAGRAQTAEDSIETVVSIDDFHAPNRICSLNRSAIIEMNSELVGLPLTPDTV